ncbi:hypothetical protein BH11MYX1_BH11MYX1_08450 [soil metagenome]
MPTLERYLCALWSLAQARREARGLTFEELAAMLDAAFTAPPGEPDLAAVPDDKGDRASFAGWERRILMQIRDLRDMAATGQLVDDQRYFGIDAPRGGRWYNFDPIGFLECGVVGAFGGWDPDGADSGRTLVPGKVVVLDPGGQLISVDAEDIEHVTVDMSQVSWDDFTALLGSGQVYE